ncbi:MAG: hypothetical protein ABEJ98_02260 [Candidatus Nanohaloarchaea archaeon]
MTASYVVRIQTNTSQQFRQKFKVNDTSENAGSRDYHRLDLNKLGFLDLNFTAPPEGTILTQNQTFFINASAGCVNGECGTIRATPRYNESSSADTLIPGSSGTPFSVEDQRVKSCDLGTGSCNLSWTVNATGDVESYHLLDVNASSSYSEVESNDTSDTRVQINTPIVFDLDFNVVDFGPVSPGDRNVSARRNDAGYNITVNEQSSTIDRLWIRFTGLDNASNSYTIPPSNMSYAFQKDISAAHKLSDSYQLAKSNVQPGTILSTFYWLDVPTGIAQASYTGTLFFKANSTG